MPKYLTQQQVDAYREQGFVSPVDIMTEEQAAHYRERLEEAENRYPDAVNAENRNNAHLVFPFFDELAHHPRIVDAVEDLIGTDIVLWGSVLFIKESESRQYVSWHQDATYMGLTPHDFVTPWLALTPSNRDNGCMSMIPGSHKGSIRKHADTFHDDNILTRGQEILEVNEDAAIDLVLRPGQISMHHARVIHGSRPNCSGERRIGAVLQCYAPSGCRQVVGENYWLPIRGERNPAHHVYLDRPDHDMDPKGVENRRRVNENWASILYHGAREKRDY